MSMCQSIIRKCLSFDASNDNQHCIKWLISRKMSKVFLFPIAVFVIFQTTFIGTYIAAIVQGHVVPAVPYISDAATYSPESCVFGQFINIGCVLLGIVIYIRYRQIQKLMYHHIELIPSTSKWNTISIYIGLSSCFGCSIVANFQETNVRIIHFIGAFTCFGLGTVYFWFQALISYNIHRYSGSIQMAHIRLGLSALCTVFFIIVAVTGIISHILFKGQDPRKWYPSDGGWKFHVASSVSEWIVSTLFSFYILSFSDEFKLITFDHPTILIEGYEHLEDNVDRDAPQNTTDATDAMVWIILCDTFHY